MFTRSRITSKVYFASQICDTIISASFSLKEKKNQQKSLCEESDAIFWYFIKAVGTFDNKLQLNL